MGDIDPFWHQMELILWQLRGMLDSWNNVFVTNSRSLTSDYLFRLTEKITDVYLLQLSGDMSEVTTALGLKEALDKWRHAGREHHLPSPSCSALIKLLPGQEDVYISQVTWQGYSSMLKVAKFYSFAWRLTRDPESPLIPGGDTLFSSYPSTLASIDDFYTTSAGLVTLETTNGNHNPDLWSFVRHGLNTSVLEVFRVMIANRLARSGLEWVSYFSRENSGTYNNQWMVFDTKLFEPRKPLPQRDLLWVAEQIPGFVQSADVTDVLREKSYWASYNNPYFKFIHNVSGFYEYEKTYGDWFNYDLHPRAQIFKRDHVKVDSLAKMYRLMRYNDFTHDPLSRCNCTPSYSAENAISARNDLNDFNGTYPFPALAYRLHGGTDVKLVNWTMATSASMIAVSGPTYDDVPPFQWSRLNPPVRKPLMQPDKWTFPPLLIQVEYPTGMPYFTIQLVH
ncbi:Putative phospholipase B-like 2 [Sparganum proliferum]